MTKKNVRGQFTTEVSKTKKKAFEAGVVSVGLKAKTLPGTMEKAIKETQESFIEMGRQEIIEKYKKKFVCLKKDVYNQIIDDAKKEGHAEGFAIGNKMTGDARYQQGVERGRVLGSISGYDRGFAVGAEEAIENVVKPASFALGVVVGACVSILGGLFGVSIGWLVDKLVF